MLVYAALPHNRLSQCMVCHPGAFDLRNQLDDFAFAVAFPMNPTKTSLLLTDRMDTDKPNRLDEMRVNGARQVGVHSSTARTPAIKLSFSQKGMLYYWV